MNRHLILLGDSIFDNALYVEGGPAVIAQVRQALSPEWRVSLLAKDGDTTVNVKAQLRRLPLEATDLILSVGGNDALQALQILKLPQESVQEALETLSKVQRKFEKNYSQLLELLNELKLPLLVCTIYDQVPGLTAGMRSALSFFNDVIVKTAVRNRVSILDLRAICTQESDYSESSPIEPSSVGGNKIALAIASAITDTYFLISHCRVYSIPVETSNKN